MSLTVPQDFSKTEPAAPAENAGEQPASLPLAETMDDAFWQSLHDGTSHAFFALGMVEPELAIIGTELEIEILGEMYKATVVEESPFDPTNIKLRA